LERIYVRPLLETPDRQATWAIYKGAFGRNPAALFYTAVCTVFDDWGWIGRSLHAEQLLGLTPFFFPLAGLLQDLSLLTRHL
jgi:hypothetical protein